MLTHTLYNAPRMMRFIFRRDRVQLPIWVASVVICGAFFAPVIPGLVGDESELGSFAALLDSPAMRAICGMSYGNGDSYASLYPQIMLVWTTLLVAVMNIFVVLRHTRKDEEEGRFEVVGSLPIGKNANLFSILSITTFANLMIALLTAVILPLFKVGGMDLTGSLLFGFSIGLCGMIFAGITAVFAQLASTSKGAMGLSLAVLGAAYLIRAVGDNGNETLARISPLGLAERSEMYVNNYVWPLFVLLAESMVFFALAFFFSGRRDLGAGILPARRGRAHASRFLSSGFGLNVRLLRSTIVAWAVVVFSFSASYGSVFGQMEEMYKSNETFAKLIGIGVDTNQLLVPIVAMLMMIMSIISAIPIIVIAQKLGTEEGRNRIEQVYSKAVSRTRTMTEMFILSVVVSVIFQFLNALGLWVAAASSMEMSMDFPVVLGAAMNNVPALICYAGIACFIVGLIPKARILTWFLLIYAFISVYLGNIMDLPEFAKKFTPFGYVTNYPVDDFEILPTVGLCVVGIAFFLLGAVFYRKRDIL